MRFDIVVTFTSIEGRPCWRSFHEWADTEEQAVNAVKSRFTAYQRTARAAAEVQCMPCYNRRGPLDMKRNYEYLCGVSQ